MVYGLYLIFFFCVKKEVFTSIMDSLFNDIDVVSLVMTFLNYLIHL